nr:hypothetical protein BgiMline_029749 [Biomphalaria glabrata]
MSNQIPPDLDVRGTYEITDFADQVEDNECSINLSNTNYLGVVRHDDRQAVNDEPDVKVTLAKREEFSDSDNTLKQSLTKNSGTAVMSNSPVKASHSAKQLKSDDTIIGG